MCQRHQEMVYNPMNFQDELQIELRKVTDCYASLSHSDLGISENEHRLHGEHLSRIIFLLNKNSHKFDRNQIMPYLRNQKEVDLFFHKTFSIECFFFVCLD